MTELEHAIKHIKTRADAWAVKEVTEALQSISERLDKALSQEPCERFEWGIDGKVYKITKAKDGKEICQQVCDDAISRDMALEKMADYVASGYADSAEDFEEYSKIICQLPSVTHKSGKWIEHPEIETTTPEYLMFYECSECGDKPCFCKSDIHKKRFCSNCGAKMVEPQERSDKE